VMKTIEFKRAGSAMALLLFCAPGRAQTLGGEASTELSRSQVLYTPGKGKY
jgi:hypothetical protein